MTADDAAFREAFDLDVPPAVEAQPGAVAAVVLAHDEALKGFAARPCLYTGSRRFTGQQDLEAVGLMRVCLSLRATFGEATEGAIR